MKPLRLKAWKSDPVLDDVAIPEPELFPGALRSPWVARTPAGSTLWAPGFGVSNQAYRDIRRGPAPPQPHPVSTRTCDSSGLVGGREHTGFAQFWRRQSGPAGGRSNHRVPQGTVIGQG
jgi:hypothetical protein